MTGFWIGVSSSATVIIAIFTIIQWRKSRIHLKGTIKRHPFIMPENLKGSLKEIFSNRYMFRNISFDSDNRNNKEIQAMLDKLIDSLEDNEIGSLYGFETVSELELYNKGQDEAKNLEVCAEGVMVIEIQTNDGWVALSQKNSYKTLRPGEKRQYRIWQSSLSKKIEVYQDRGRAVLLELKFAHPSYEFLSELLNVWKVLLPVLIFFGITTNFIIKFFQ